MWASSNCSLVRASITCAPSAIATSTARGVSGVGVPSSSNSGPRFRATMCSTLGGGSPSEPTESATNSSSVANPRARLCSRSKPIVEEDLLSMPELPQSEPPRCPGQTSTCPAARTGARAASGRSPPRPRALDRQVRPGHVADEQRVAGQHGPGIAAAAAVAEEEGGVLGAVAGRVHRLDRHRAQLAAPAVGERLVRVLGRRPARGRGSLPRSPGQPPVAGHVVGVVVGLEHVLDPHPVQAAQPQVGIDVPLRVDHRGDPATGVADQIGGAAEVLVEDLAEQHPLSLGSAMRR